MRRTAEDRRREIEALEGWEQPAPADRVALLEGALRRAEETIARLKAEMDRRADFVRAQMPQSECQVCAARKERNRERMRRKQRRQVWFHGGRQTDAT